MAHALADPDSLDKLIIVDMSPARGAISAEFARYIDGMRKVQAANVSSKREADVILQPYEEVSCGYFTGGSKLTSRVAEPRHPSISSDKFGQIR